VEVTSGHGLSVDIFGILECASLAMVVVVLLVVRGQITLVFLFLFLLLLPPPRRQTGHPQGPVVVVQLLTARLSR